jgi:hypothetical protein
MMHSETAAQLRRRIAAPRHNYDKAIRNNTGVNINGYHFWTAPMLVGDIPGTRTTEELAEATELLKTLVSISRDALAREEERLEGHEFSSLTTTNKTKILTYAMRGHLMSLSKDDRSFYKDNNSYAELHIPFRPGDAVHPGRVDLALLRRGKPDILIEIDHAPKTTSEDKLRFIAEEGGIGLWIRWDAWEASAVY